MLTKPLSLMIAFLTVVLIGSPAVAQDQEPEFFKPRFVVTQHVILLEGHQVVTWEKIEELISTFPNPQQCRPQFYFTRSAFDGGMEEVAKKKIMDIHKKYQLSGHSIGSLWPQADARYDIIRTEADLIPNPELKKTGTVVFDGKPVVNAEVLLVPKTADETYSIYMEDGHTRNNLEHIVTYTNNKGEFSIYPEKDVPFWVVVMHSKAGFRAVSNTEFASESKISLLAWGKLNLTLAEVPGEVQYPNLQSIVTSHEGLPTLQLIQYMDVRKGEDAPQVFEFKLVPPFCQTDISRCFSSGGGTSHCLPGASVNLDFGNEINLTLGPLSETQKATLKQRRQ